MNSNNDYYRILGVLDDTEDIVIKAAYRALAQRYHSACNSAFRPILGLTALAAHMPAKRYKVSPL